MHWFWQHPAECRQVIVNAGDNAFRGILWRRRGGYLIMRQVVLLRPHAEPLPLDGEVLVPQEQVDFIQVV